MFSTAGKNFVPHWAKAIEVLIGLVISPLIGFGLALTLIYIAHVFIKKREYFKAPYWSWDHPNLAMRSTLIFASGLVSFMHGKNDGQKGVGIATLILITLIPGSFAINPNLAQSDIEILGTHVKSISTQIAKLDAHSDTNTALLTADIKIATSKLDTLITDAGNGKAIDRLNIRKNILKLKESYTSLTALESNGLIPSANAGGGQLSLSAISKDVDSLTSATDYVPWWIIVLVSIAIGSGTLVGWKRIVKTIGEKIGKYKMNYSQAASSALVTAGTIGLASGLGLPVSTTHVMSSSVAGTMVEEHGWRNGVDPHMIKHILLAWALTMPTTIIIAGSIFLILQWIFVR